MKSKYQELQRTKAVKLIQEKNPIFYGAKSGRKFLGTERDFVLKECENNLFKPISDDAIKYFKSNKIAWWMGTKPTGHVLSSQIACINHLFSLRNDKVAVLDLLKNISSDFVDVMKIENDKFLSGYIQFEAVSDYGYLNEGKSTRGSSCTSIDALIFALHKDNSKWLIPIEWKYTEHYENQNKANEGCRKNPEKCKGKERKRRYSNLINASSQLIGKEHYCFYFEPFYQLMRQTLWAEKMVENKNNETIKADNYLHIHVIPKENGDLLHKTYKCSGLDMETTWKNHIVDKNKYKIIAPKDFLANINQEKYSELINYLAKRYWNEK